MGPDTDSCATNNIKGLLDLCKAIPNSETLKMVEIGSYLGVSTEVFCLFFKEVIAIDVWGMDSTYSEADWARCKNNFSWETVKSKCLERLKPYPHCSIIHNFNHIAATSFVDKSLDFVYIDGNHGKLTTDIMTWLPKIKNGGYIGGHDNYHFNSNNSNVNGINFSQRSNFSDTSWLLKLP